MQSHKKKLPIGIENFAELQTEEFYYVDKTDLIRELLEHWAKVNLFTRPGRFGKSLNMSMLKHFFEVGENKEFFQNTAIAKETPLCENYMGKFSVISISLKGINAENYEKSCAMAAQVICAEARRFQYLLDSERLTEYDKKAYLQLLESDMSEAVLCSSLKILSELLEKHHENKVILLIDEYDAPLAKAFERGYYDRMELFIRNLFEYALKTNDSLKFAVLTGCMGISRESIFTGLNNLKVLSVTEVQFDECFGFTDCEVMEIMEYYGLSRHYQEMKDWYDGYEFGNMKVYCPWDVLNYCNALLADPDAKPGNYWINMSSNEVVNRFMQQSDTKAARREIEKLIAGGTITKEIHQELTYKEMYSSVENIWSVLYATGYLTKKGKPDGDVLSLAIPNMEIRNIFTAEMPSEITTAI